MRDRGGQVDPATMRASLEQHLGSRQVSRIVYGAIIGLALIVALDSHPPEPGVMAIWLLGTAVAVGLAEVYSEIGGPAPHPRRGGPPPRRGPHRGGRRRRRLRRRVSRGVLRDCRPRTPRGRDGVLDREVDRARPDRLLRLLGGPVRRRHLARRAGQGTDRGADRRRADRTEIPGALTGGPAEKIPQADRTGPDIARWSAMPAALRNRAAGPRPARHRRRSASRGSRP